MKTFFVILSILACVVPIESITKEEALTKLDGAIKDTEQAVNKIFDRWEIAKYPSFLRAAAMSHTAYEVLKVKFEVKILTSLLADDAGKKQNKVVISFLGSSVTAGHDSPYNQSFPEQTKVMMAPAFKQIGITFEVNNAAMGNNPCAPYDLCVKTFAGPDADIIQWEQSYNCFGSDKNGIDTFEQFTRQTMNMKSKPVVIYSGSDTPNWGADACKKMPDVPVIEDEDLALLAMYRSDGNVKSIVQKNNNNGGFSALVPAIPGYKMSGVQLWDHHHYQSYKCYGPYVVGWGCCSASWHPSLLGHELRAAHYSFFWLLIYKDALLAVQDKIANGRMNHIKHEKEKVEISKLLEETTHHYHQEHKHTQAKPFFPTVWTDDVQCHTAYEPIYDKGMIIDRLIINNQVDAVYFQKIIFEDLLDVNIVKNAKRIGYLDYKYTFTGNNASKPLSIKLRVKQVGNTFICQPPGVWGKMPDGVQDIFDKDIKYYLTKDIKNYDKLEPWDIGQRNGTNSAASANLFDFKKEESKEMQVVKEGLCAMFSEKFPAGDHVLTVVPPSQKHILISTILIP